MHINISLPMYSYFIIVISMLQVINAVKPDIVVIELCYNRNSILSINESTIANVSGITLGIYNIG